MAYQRTLIVDTKIAEPFGALAAIELQQFTL